MMGLTLRHYLLWSLGLAKPSTQTTANEREALARYVMSKSIAVEIGVWHGVTTCRLLQSMSSDGTIYAVDPYPAGALGFSMHERIARHEVGKIRGVNVHWVKATGAEAARRLASDLHEKVEFIFIDGG